MIAGGVLLGNYISRPISEIEDGLLAIINGSSDLRFQLEHAELGGLVFRINSLLNALMGVPEDTTDEQGPVVAAALREGVPRRDRRRRGCEALAPVLTGADRRPGDSRDHGTLRFSEQEGRRRAPKKTSNKELARLEKLVANKLSQNYDRQEAIEELGKMACARARRCCSSASTGRWIRRSPIRKRRNPRRAASWRQGRRRSIRSASTARRAESLTWPLKVLKEIVPRERFAEELLAMLDLFDTEYVRNAQPKVQLIAMLEEHPSEDVRVAVEPFLGDASEPVRFTAVATIFAMNDSTVVPSLVAALEQEESLRVKNRIARGSANAAGRCPKSSPTPAQRAAGRLRASRRPGSPPSLASPAVVGFRARAESLGATR